MALTIKSVYALFVLCSDLVYVLLFPQLLCAIYFPFVNGYGSIIGYIVGLVLRLGGGEKLVGLTPFIVYPLYLEEEKRQLFPFRTLSMFASFITLILTSLLFKYLFEKEILPAKYDLLGILANKGDLQKMKFAESTGTFKTKSTDELIKEHKL